MCCPLDTKHIHSLWFQWSCIIKILHDIIKHKLISIYNSNYNKLNYVWNKQLSFPNYSWNFLRLSLTSNALRSTRTQCFLFVYYTKLVYTIIKYSFEGKKHGLNYFNNNPSRSRLRFTLLTIVKSFQSIVQ